MVVPKLIGICQETVVIFQKWIFLSLLHCKLFNNDFFIIIDHGTKNTHSAAILFLIRLDFFSPLPALIDHPVGAFLHNVEAPARDAYE